MENLQSLFSHVPYCILNKDCIDMSDINYALNASKIKANDVKGMFE